ncbi:DUF4198 domain-containing protein [Jannaschia sp. Os4]|uniref:DUF4198 domain-containing protein n=1 Tax=Jannaschia sp. Os4 TaxID=2807617 RepID=UPI00193A742E|nr:DUF4198 domain-containing protein [Jannaschia sp. Os4]MBM2575909.1 DUF4198 domain-containing protein [Jannaschia sp. Os4]
MPRIPTLFAAALCLAMGQAQAHEFWIEPESFEVEAGDPLAATFRNGEAFVGSTFSFLPTRSERLDLVAGGAAAPIDARVGDNPAIQLDEAPDGLVALVHETGESALTYRPRAGRSGWERFVGFVTHKQMTGILEAHKAAGLPEEGVTEGYVRYAKALVAVGDGAGQDAPTGLRTEIVALANPYTDDLADGLPVRVILDGEPRSGAQVELFARAPDGTVEITLHDADADGVAVLPVEPGHVYLADSVAMKPGPGFSGGDGPMWRSLWAALTFAVPEA